MKINKQNQGFALVEVIIGISILVVIFMAVSQLLFMSLRSTQITLQSFQAYKFAEEGIELTRAIRDSNWRRNIAWDGNVKNVPGVVENFSEDGFYTVSFDSNNQILMTFRGVEGDWNINKDEICLYQHKIGTNSIIANHVIDLDNPLPFSRLVEIKRLDPYKVAVRSLVSWEDYKIGRQTMELKTELTDWKGGAL